VEEEKESWKDLCALAAKEQNPDRLLELVRQISDLLEERERRLRRNSSADPLN
jgi:hypothetical protein